MVISCSMCGAQTASMRAIFIPEPSKVLLGDKGKGACPERSEARQWSGKRPSMYIFVLKFSSSIKKGLKYLGDLLRYFYPLLICHSSFIFLIVPRVPWMRECKPLAILGLLLPVGVTPFAPQGLLLALHCCLWGPGTWPLEPTLQLLLGGCLAALWTELYWQGAFCCSMPWEFTHGWCWAI